MKRVMMFVLPGALVLVACATQKTLEATGGSKADGVVELSYEYGMFEQPNVDLQAGVETARARCAAWGYQNAEPFGGQKKSCNASDAYGSCIHWFVTVSYQCTGGASR